MDQPLISVVIPVFNMELYLARCLDSVLNNSYRNLEIICVDDGSKDRSLEILHDYEKRDSRIVVIAKKNGGVSSARNAGLDRMTGEFVSFVDPDDFIHRQFFEILFAAQQKKNADYVIGQYQTVTDDDLPSVCCSYELHDSDILELNCSQLFRNIEYRRYCTIRLIRANKIGSLRFRQDMHYGEDTTFVAELWEQHPQMVACVVPQILYFYYHRESSASVCADESKKIAMLRLFAQKVNQSSTNELIYLDHIIRFALSSRDIALYIHHNHKDGREYSALLSEQLLLLRKTGVYSAKEKAVLTLFIYFPRIHWEHRVMRDHSLRKWERNAKQQRQEIKGIHKC